jgi:hypothetical protein
MKMLLRIARFSSEPKSTVESAKNIVNSILHGTERSFKEGEDLHNTHSKLLAKGKTVNELSVHNVKPEHMDSYIQLVYGITN